jgi:hypothetical protein
MKIPYNFNAWRTGIMIAAFCLSVAASYGRTVSPLYGRGNTVIPEPQKVTIGERDFPFGSDWQLQLERGVEARDVAVTGLIEDLAERFNLTLESHNAGRHRAKLISFLIAPNSVSVEQSAERDREIIAQQAYALDLAPDRIKITANSSQGLFYGVQTLLQLIKPQAGNLWLPEAHPPDRTIDMSYLVYRQLLLPFGDWTEKLQAVRNSYAQAHKLPQRDAHFDWNDIKSIDLDEQALEEMP